MMAEQSDNVVAEKNAEPESEPDIALKLLVVLVYTSIGAAIASAKLVWTTSSFPVAWEPHLELPAWLLLGAVLTLALVLSAHGKRSESWAVIAYGSLSAGFIKCLATVMWIGWDVLQKSGWGVAALVLPCIALVAWGMHAALRRRWQRMLGISLLMFFAWVFVGLQLNYATYFYSLRHPLPKKQEIIPGVKEAQ